MKVIKLTLAGDGQEKIYIRSDRVDSVAQSGTIPGFGYTTVRTSGTYHMVVETTSEVLKMLGWEE